MTPPDSEEAKARVDRITQHGFTFGPLTVTRMSVLPEGRVCLRVATEHRTLDIYATKAGHSLRVFSHGDELKPATKED